MPFASHPFAHNIRPFRSADTLLPAGQRWALTPLPSRTGILVGILLRLQLETRQTQSDRLNRDQQDGHVQRRAALVAESTPVWLLRHGDVLPAASPREEGVDLVGSVDGVEEDDGDEGGGETDQGGDESRGGVGCGFGAELVGRLSTSW
jgi:hypothetical protein